MTEYIHQLLLQRTTPVRRSTPVPAPLSRGTPDDLPDQRVTPRRRNFAGPKPTSPARLELASTDQERAQAQRHDEICAEIDPLIAAHDRDRQRERDEREEAELVAALERSQERFARLQRRRVATVHPKRRALARRAKAVGATRAKPRVRTPPSTNSSIWTSGPTRLSGLDKRSIANLANRRGVSFREAVPEFRRFQQTARRSGWSNFALNASAAAFNPDLQHPDGTALRPTPNRGGQR